MITIKGPQGGFVSIIPVAGCRGCPFGRYDDRNGSYCGHHEADAAELDETTVMANPSWKPDWCPAIAEAQDDLPGTADLEFMLNDAIKSLKGETNE